MNTENIKKIFELAYKNHKENNFETAEKLYNKVLSIDSNHFGSIYLLGSLFIQTKNLNKAKTLLQRAIQIDPNYSDAHYNLGNALAELQEFEKAIICFKKAAEINPKNADTHNNLGNLLKKIGQIQEAENCYKKAIEINPNYVNAYNNLGTIFQKRNNFKEAIKFYEKTIQLEPNFANAYNNLGLIFHELEEYQKAISHYKKAIKIKPNYSETYSNLGKLFKDLGNFEKTINCFEKAIKYKPDDLISLYYSSELKNEILNTDLQTSIIKIINNKNCTKINLAYGNFLLSIYEKQKQNYENEFNFLLKGHLYYLDSQKENFFDTVKIDYWSKVSLEIEKLFNSNKFGTLKNENNDKIKPIFIIGVPRCGSTLVEKVLASGEINIPIGEETAILSVFFEQEKLLEKKSINVRDIENFRMKLLDKYKRKKLISERSNYIFTDKSLDNFFYIGLIKAIYPHAKVINCKRNALSSIVSILQNNLTGISWAHDIENIFRYFDIYHRMINNYVKIFPNFVYELELEKFTNNPESESKKLMEYCDLPWNEKCLEYYKRKDVISQTASNIQIREAIYKTSNEKYLPYKKFLTQYGEKYSWFK